ncbi:hypothetical protein ABT297_13855 [Dactylosporangium sp. NPDC000555]|uniref:hypothetical protein n=1 Tax=Dactylosporangium sp. NPDC000555 TaxID=3154260 RepID=UPI0033238284
MSRPLRAGLPHRTVGTVAAPPTGSLMPRGRVLADGVTGLFDEVIGGGLLLLTTEDPGSLGDALRATLTRIGVRTVRVVAATTPATAAEAADLDDVYLPFFAAARARFIRAGLRSPGRRPDQHDRAAAP